MAIKNQDDSNSQNTVGQRNLGGEATIVLAWMAVVRGRAPALLFSILTRHVLYLLLEATYAIRVCM